MPDSNDILFSRLNIPRRWGQHLFFITIESKLLAATMTLIESHSKMININVTSGLGW
jgi:hypothetical protein